MRKCWERLPQTGGPFSFDRERHMSTSYLGSRVGPGNAFRKGSVEVFDIWHSPKQKPCRQRQQYAAFAARSFVFDLRTLNLGAKKQGSTPKENPLKGQRRSKNRIFVMKDKHIIVQNFGLKERKQCKRFQIERFGRSRGSGLARTFKMTSKTLGACL